MRVHKDNSNRHSTIKDECLNKACIDLDVDDRSDNHNSCKKNYYSGSSGSTSSDNSNDEPDS
jgi:hypothetical protein